MIVTGTLTVVNVAPVLSVTTHWYIAVTEPALVSVSLNDVDAAVGDVIVTVSPDK